MHCQPDVSRCLARALRQRQFLATLLVIGLCFLLGPVSPAMSQDNTWTGDGADNLWDNPDNWSAGTVPQGGDEEVLLSVDAEGANGPLIQDGIDAIAGVLVAALGEPIITMTGGSLELNDWGVWWGDWAGTAATFNISGGVINLTGNPGILEMGWLDDEDPTPGNSGGVWNISGGEVNVKGIQMPTECPDNRCSGTINLSGGTLNVGSARGGMILREHALVDIAGGVLVLEGDQEAQIEDYVDQGLVTAYGGDGQLSITYNDDDFLTTVVATSVAMPGDYNNDKQLTAADLDLQAGVMMGEPGGPQYDLNSDGKVDFEDRLEWLHELKNVYVGDADLNGEFNSADFVQVFVSGKYETQQSAGWAEGDFDGNQVFDSGDFVAAFTDGGYELGPRPTAVSAVPEPSSAVLLLLGLLALTSSVVKPSSRHR